MRVSTHLALFVEGRVLITTAESWETALALSYGRLLFLTLISSKVLKIGNIQMTHLNAPVRTTGYDLALKTFQMKTEVF